MSKTLQMRPFLLLEVFLNGTGGAFETLRYNQESKKTIKSWYARKQLG